MDSAIQLISFEQQIKRQWLRTRLCVMTSSRGGSINVEVAAGDQLGRGGGGPSDGEPLSLGSCSGAAYEEEEEGAATG